MSTSAPYETLLPGFKCLRCGHTWVARLDVSYEKGNRPRRCGKCGDPNWDRPRRDQDADKTPSPKTRKSKKG